MFACGSSGKRKPNKWDSINPEIGIDQGNLLVQGDPGFGRIKLPGRFVRIADGEPGVVDDVVGGREALDFLGFEIKRVLGDEDRWIGPAFQFDGAMNVLEGAMAGADI